jgi:methylmalonyl-CoA/ethylmalonyl-CoA epimerase
MNDNDGREEPAMVWQNVNKVDHVVFMVWPENLDAARSTFQTMLGVTFEGPIDAAAQGVRIYIDWDAGIELMSPVDPDTAVAPMRFLRERGEGVWRIVFGVASVDDALAQAATVGVHELFRAPNCIELSPSWSERFERIDECPMETVHGVSLSYGDIRRL